MIIKVGVNGFGRFALNLLWCWLRDRNAQYQIAYINDEGLTPEDIVEIIKTDPLVSGFKKCKVVLQGHVMLLQEPDGRTVQITLTHGPAENVPWIGLPDLFFECSGKRSATANLCRPFLQGSTKAVIVSATCYDADATLIMGYNHESYSPKEHKVISYGSCTVNPGVTLTNFLHGAYGVDECFVNVIHNIQRHRLENGAFHTLERKHCTLESMAPKLLPFIPKEKFTVNYTVIPWDGASIIDFAFRLKQEPARDAAVERLKGAVGQGGPLAGLLDVIPEDTGPHVHLGSPYSAVIVESGIKVLGPTLHLFCYFYNEGSGIRMHELANHIAKRLD